MARDIHKYVIMDKQLILMCGLPAAGKSSVVEAYKADGFRCISRDVIGGTGEDVDNKLKLAIAAGDAKIILDNTYITAERRKGPIKIGRDNGFRVTCVHMDTSFEDAQFNAVTRMVKRHGRMFTSPADYKAANDPNMFPVAAMYSARKEFQKPTTAEGFDEVKVVKFKRNQSGYTNKAIIFDYDGTLRKTKSGAKYPVDPSDIEILPGRIEMLKKLQSEGYILLGVSNQSGVAKGHLTEEMARKCFEHTNALLGFDIDVSFCPHSVPPIICYCRKPGVGHGVEFIEKYKLDPSQCIMVGDMTTDKTFAARCGFKYVDESKFFQS